MSSFRLENSDSTSAAEAEESTRSFGWSAGASGVSVGNSFCIECL